MDCNRAQAVNKDSSNTSIWTNNVSSGIRLDPGDTVSVHSAFINEIGSGADTIEFLGNYLTTTSLSYTTGMYAPPSDNPSVVKDNAVGIVVSSQSQTPCITVTFARLTQAGTVVCFSTLLRNHRTRARVFLR